ncbi:MAG: hypothetical protein QOJ12_709 [Thermoleophilales bacterium]|nr:hypothetical protein [Thermoleophilales bacterium]
MGRGDRELELALRRADRAIGSGFGAEYAAAPPVHPLAHRICTTAKRHVNALGVARPTRRGHPRFSHGSVAAARRFWAQATREANFLLNRGASDNDIALVGSCLAGLEQAIRRVESQLSFGAGAPPPAYPAVRRRIGQRLRLPV